VSQPKYQIPKSGKGGESNLKWWPEKQIVANSDTLNLTSIIFRFAGQVSMATNYQNK